MGMQIVFSPARSDRRLRLRREGDALVINRKRFDFTEMAAGTECAVDSDWFAGPVQRAPDGTLVIKLVLPHGAKASKKRLYPSPIRVEKDGVIRLPR